MFLIEEELKKLPAKPGVYLMHDERDEIIYVGKAVSLKTVCGSIFRAAATRVRKSSRWSLILQDLNISSQIQSWKLLYWKAI